MTRKEAEDLVARIREKAEKAFTEETGIAPSVYNENRAPFLVGYMESSFIAWLENNSSISQLS